MKKKIKVYDQKRGSIEKEVQYIPIRYILAILITLLEIIAIMAIVFIMAIYVPYFYIALIITVIGVVISIIASNDNPDYKVPWILFVIVLPIVGFMLYFLFYERRLQKKLQKRLKKITDSLIVDDNLLHQKLSEKDKLIASQARCLTKIANTNLYQNTKLKYYSIGEDLYQAMLVELNKATSFIFLEYFIIEEGVFWNSILDILIAKAKQNVEIKVVYDDIGCMTTLPGNYYKLLKKYNIDCVPFSRLKGQADSEFNNRSHRKILVIDGKVGFTGGVNIADEYINVKEKYGHWKDTGIKLEGDAVKELTKLFLIDFYLNSKDDIVDFDKYYIQTNIVQESYVVPFGDGPKPIYEKNVGKIVIMNMINQAKDYVYIMTPYLIIDNELMRAIENASIRGVDIRIIVPHIPDKKIIFEMTKSNYQILMASNVKIYEYEPGFIHSKLFLSDDKVAMIGTINLDYRSLTHHFENGIWIYDDEVLKEIKEDFAWTMNQSININGKKEKEKILSKLIKSIVKIFSPLL